LAKKEFSSDEINGKTLRFGSTSEGFAKIAETMGMNVIYWNLLKKTFRINFFAGKLLKRQTSLRCIY
jgi:hypothetical protein